MPAKPLPNFLFIGTAKAGSSWIFEILREHPQVFVPDAKDLHFFDKYYDRRRVIDVVNRSEPNDLSNPFVVICCEFGAVLGYVMLNMLPGLEWLPDWPYWESSIVDSTENIVWGPPGARYAPDGMVWVTTV